jgi:hypothetical protein
MAEQAVLQALIPVTDARSTILGKQHTTLEIVHGDRAFCGDYHQGFCMF